MGRATITASDRSWRRTAAPISAPNLGHDLPGEATRGSRAAQSSPRDMAGRSGVGGALSALIWAAASGRLEAIHVVPSGTGLCVNRLADTADVSLTWLPSVSRGVIPGLNSVPRS